MNCVHAIQKDHRRRHVLDLLKDILELYADIDPAEAVSISLSTLRTQLAEAVSISNYQNWFATSTACYKCEIMGHSI